MISNLTQPNLPPIIRDTTPQIPSDVESENDAKSETQSDNSDYSSVTDSYYSGEFDTTQYMKLEEKQKKKRPWITLI